jgi:hypothetical protein
MAMRLGLVLGQLGTTWDNCIQRRQLHLHEGGIHRGRKKWVVPKINLLAKITKGKVEARVELGV